MVAPAIPIIGAVVVGICAVLATVLGAAYMAGYDIDFSIEHVVDPKTGTIKQVLKIQIRHKRSDEGSSTA